MFRKNKIQEKDDLIFHLKKMLKNSTDKYEEALIYAQEIENRFIALKATFFSDLGEYIDSNFVENIPNENSDFSKNNNFTGTLLFQIDYNAKIVPEEIEKVLKNVEVSFSNKLMEIIRLKNLNEVEVYKKADIDRRHFSKIRSNSDYRPTKDTIILLCLSMNLNYEEVEDLLNRAGFSFSKSDKRDLIAEYFFKKHNYDILLYKETLYKYGFLKD